MKTAISELLDELKQSNEFCDNDERKWVYTTLIRYIENNYIDKEKQQIIEAYYQAKTEIHNEDVSFKTGEQYYNDTYEK